jgi:hypothetical protein
LIDEVIKSSGFTKSEQEFCLYKKFIASPFTFLILYANDILLFRNNVQMLQETKKSMERNFQMKDLGEADL